MTTRELTIHKRQYYKYTVSYTSTLDGKSVVEYEGGDNLFAFRAAKKLCDEGFLGVTVAMETRKQYKDHSE